MKIGIYDPYLDDLGGGEKYIMTIAECLTPSHEVSVFWDDPEDLKELRRRFSLDIGSVRLVKNIFSQKISFWTRLFETSKYDALIVLSDGSIPLTLSKKLFLHLQQPLRTMSVSSWKDKLKLLRVTGIFYNSTFTQSFNKHFPDRLSSVIYPPVALFPKKVKKENIIMHVGRFRPQDPVVGVRDYKKQSVMIEAFKQMVDGKQVNDWKFIMAVSVKKEDEDKFALLQKSAKGYPIEFFINKTNDELWNLYNKAKIYWHASGYGEDLQKHPEYAEHFGISTVEAMGAGVVPVVINAGGQTEIVTDGVNGLLWNSLEELQKKTEQLMKDQELLETLSDEAGRRAEDFGKEKFCEAINQLINK